MPITREHVDLNNGPHFVMDRDRVWRVVGTYHVPSITSIINSVIELEGAPMPTQDYMANYAYSFATPPGTYVVDPFRNYAFNIGSEENRPFSCDDCYNKVFNRYSTAPYCARTCINVQGNVSACAHARLKPLIRKNYPTEGELMEETCCRCGKVLTPDDTFTVGWSTYCGSCINDSHRQCAECGDWVLRSLAYENTSGEDICQQCYAENYFLCSCCNDTHHRDDLEYEDNGYMLCSWCREDHICCNECGVLVHYDDAVFDDNDEEYYCYACHRRMEMNEGPIESYCYRPRPIFSGTSTSKRPLYMGIELEVDRGNNKGATARAIRDTTDLVYLKYDSSLENGFEIVSHPATLDFHLNDMPWRSITELCRAEHWKSHNCDTCGLHVHVNRTYFGANEDTQDLNIAKLIILVNNIWPEFITLSRRPETHWAQKVKLDIQPEDNRFDIAYKAKRCARDGRYQAINITNDETVEFRSFKGTLVPETLLATLELVATLCRYSKSRSLQKIQIADWTTFKAAANGKYLPTYISSKGL